MRGTVFLLVALVVVALGASVVTAQDAARVRVAAAVVVGPDDERTGSVIRRCSDAGGCGRRAERVGIDDDNVVVEQGEAIVEATIADGGRATAAARSVSLLGGVVKAYGVRRSVTIDTATTVREGVVHGLQVGGQMIGDVEERKRFELPDGLGTVTANTRDAALRLVLARAYGDLAAGQVLEVARVTAGLRERAEPEAEPEPTATPEPDDDDDAAAAESARRKRAARKDDRDKAKRKRKRAPSVQARLSEDGFTFPVFGSGITLADDYGAARAKPIVKHEGNDVFAPLGAPVLAVTDGRVVKVGTLPISGNRLWLVTDDGDAFFYAHLSAFAPEAVNGNRVRAGTVLGFTGSTGDAEPTPPHVHFEIHPGGVEEDAIDPHPFLTAWRDNRDVAPGAWLSRYGKDPAERPGALVEVEDFIARGSG